MNHFDAFGDAGLREALQFVRGRAAPVTADDTAAALGIHRTVARSRLERLLRAGLLETSFARTSGRAGPGAGRPAKLYAPAPEQRALEFPPRRIASIVGRLLDELPARGRDAALRRVGEGYGHDIATAAGVRAVTGARRGLEAVCAGLRSLGFPVTLERADANGAVISTPDCPLRPLVRDHPEAAEIDRGMWAALVERGVRGLGAADVRCCTQGCHGAGGSCTVTVTFAFDTAG
jgi:predicted ArsR family transcriptional regulator